MAGLTRAGFAARLASEIDDAGWDALEHDAALDINDFNRATLLRLRGLDAGDGPVDEEKAAELRAMLESYLAQYMADRPDAQRWVVLSCLALAFAIGEPMHPVEVVKAQVRVNADGTKEYFCPMYDGPETLCGFCACEPLPATGARA